MIFVELIDAIFDRVEDIIKVEIARVEEHLENSFNSRKNELTHKNCGVPYIIDDEGELLF